MLIETCEPEFVDQSNNFMNWAAVSVNLRRVNISSQLILPNADLLPSLFYVSFLFLCIYKTRLEGALQIVSLV